MVYRWIWCWEKKDRSGVAPLKDQGQLHSDSQSLADILNDQFSSVFAVDPPGCNTSLYGPSYPPIGEIYFDVKGVDKLLSNIDVNKATGPDQVPCRILKELSAQIAPMLTAIFTQSFTTGRLPSQRSAAFLTPVFKKGPVCQAENYRPVSLICVTCKLMEHILCSHIRSLLDLHWILSPLQHGFRARFSCETQLLTTLHDLFKIRDRGVQLDLAILDFSKAFDKVPHRRLMSKLRHYGIVGPTQRWIEAFLSDRT